MLLFKQSLATYLILLILVLLAAFLSFSFCFSISFCSISFISSSCVPYCLILFISDVAFLTHVDDGIGIEVVGYVGVAPGDGDTSACESLRDFFRIVTGVHRVLGTEAELFVSAHVTFQKITIGTV